MNPKSASLPANMPSQQSGEAAPLPPPPHDIGGLKARPIAWGELGVWLVVGLGASYLVWRLCRAYLAAKAARPAPVVAKTPKDEKAELLRRLQLLEVPQPFDELGREHYYFELSMSLKRCLEITSHLPVTDMTTPEIKASLDNLKGSTIWHPQQKADALAFFDKADAIKFAYQEIGIAEAEKDRNHVESLARALIGRMLG